MKNVPECCITDTNDSVVKFEEKRSTIRFHNPHKRKYKRVQVDGCALSEGAKCDNMLCSHDEREEWYIELKGSDVPHAIRISCASSRSRRRPSGTMGCPL
jgi:hypothetical protein